VSARALTPRLDALKPYGVAVVTVGLALPVAQALWPSIRPTVSPVFLAAVPVGVLSLVFAFRVQERPLREEQLIVLAESVP